MVKNIAIGTGRRKTAVARVFVREGSGKIVVNGKDVKEYFPLEEQVKLVAQPLLVTSNDSKYDIVITVVGGGLNGQAAACLHGISRALLQIDPDCHTSLKANGYLTRDSRMVERRKAHAEDSSSLNVSLWLSTVQSNFRRKSSRLLLIRDLLFLLELHFSKSFRRLQ